ncbi:hypothetical protein KI387_041736, partial [Taxus chinensis]
SSISDNRLRWIFKIGNGSDLEAIKLVLGGKYLFEDGWCRVNSSVALVFVENILIIEPSKPDVVNLALRWVRSSFCGNLVAEVQKCNVAFWAVGEEVKLWGGMDLSIFRELECHHGELMAFTEKLAVFSHDKNAGRTRFKLPNLAALNSPIEPVPLWWMEIHETAGEAYNHLWHGWANEIVAQDCEEGVVERQGSPVVILSVSSDSGD